MSLLGRENDSLHAIRLVHIAASSVEKDNVVENVSSQCLQSHSTGSCQGKISIWTIWNMNLGSFNSADG